MANTKRALAVVGTLALYLAGIFWFWPLAVLGVFIGAYYSVFAGVVLGFLLDLLWGAPPGVLHVLYVPWTLAACAVALMRVLAPRFFFSRGSDTL